MRYLLDTNVVSYMMKQNNPLVDRHLLGIPSTELGISALTEGELRLGAERLPPGARMRRVVAQFLSSVTILPWDSDAAREYGQMRAHLESAGQRMGALDMLIAAHALASGLILVTGDRSFARIKKLKVEDWTKL